MKADYRLLVLTGFTIVLWGFWGFFGKLALERRMAPMTIFLSEVIVSALLAPPIWYSMHRRISSSSLATWNIFGVISGTALALGLLCYYFALAHGRASVVVPLTATYPVISVLLSVAVLAEKPTAVQWLGMLLVVVGGILLLSGPTR